MTLQERLREYIPTVAYDGATGVLADLIKDAADALDAADANMLNMGVQIDDLQAEVARLRGLYQACLDGMEVARRLRDKDGCPSCLGTGLNIGRT